jgi:general secretion pathway protein F
VPEFAYRAVDETGKRSRGLAEAGTLAAVRQSLEARGLYVLDVSASDESVAPGAGTGRGSRRSVLEATRALAALLPAGIPLARALGIASTLTGEHTAQALRAVRDRVEHGSTLADALAHHSEQFSSLYVGLVRAGERSGTLEQSFVRLAEQLDREDRLRGRILSLSIYPLILAVGGGVAVLALLLFVLPRFAELLVGTGATLPRSTATLLALSGLLQRWWPAVVGAPIAIALVISSARATAEGRHVLARLTLALPLVGGLRRQTLAARFARLTGTLVSGGAPLLGALDDTAECIDDAVAAAETSRIRARVREGVALQRAIGESGLFPPLLAQLVGIGEESGKLPEFMLKAAELFEERTERAVQRAVTLIEPGMIVFFGVIVAFVALSLLQAIYGVNANALR